MGKIAWKVSLVVVKKEYGHFVTKWLVFIWKFSLWKDKKEEKKWVY